jgi:DNA repair protein RecO
MHHIYHTEGLILDSMDVGEAGRRYAIFTRELGLVYARATGVRKLSSKLRFTLQDFAYVKVDLVQGKNFWRVTSASSVGALGGLAKNRDTLEVFANVARLLRRLLAASEPNETLFDDLLKGLYILEGCATAENRRNIEVVIVLRALHNLGYIGGGGLDHIIESPFEEELVYKISPARKEALRQINQALKGSQL